MDHTPTHPPLPIVILQRLSWMGLIMALYGGSIVAAAWVLVHGHVDWIMTELAAGLTMSVYLLDRVKLHDRMHDPADAVAHPTRHAFITSHIVLLRLLCLTLALSVMITGWFVHPLMPALAIGALGGVLVYGSLPRTQRRQRRPKDVLIIKNLAVAVAFTAMTLAMMWFAGTLPDGRGALEMLSGVGILSQCGVSIFIMLHIFTDAMISDIDDARADARFGTETIVNQINTDGTWQLALLLNIIAAIWLCGIASAGWIEQPPAVIIAMLLPVGTAIVRKLNPARVRTAIDLKMPIAVGIAIGLMWLIA